jgi:hypothetical protein
MRRNDDVTFSVVLYIQFTLHRLLYCNEYENTRLFFFINTNGIHNHMRVTNRGNSTAKKKVLFYSLWPFLLDIEAAANGRCC